MGRSVSRSLRGVLGFGPLREWMKADDVKQRPLAAALDVEQQTVSARVNERTRPKTERLRIQLEVLSDGKVHRALWLNEAERKPLVVKPIGRTGTAG